MDRLTLARGFAGRTVRQQVVDAERFGVGVVGVQRVHQRRPFLDDPHPRVAMAVDPTLMPLGQAEPALQIEIVVDLIARSSPPAKRPARKLRIKPAICSWIGSPSPSRRARIASKSD